MAPPITIYQGIHGGKLPRSNSFLSIDQPNLIVPAIKQAEDNNDIVIRCVETSGIATKASIDLRFAGIRWNGSFRALEIKTLLINMDSGKITETNLLEEEIESG